jgi:CDP-glucose 4,6-dehydratase
MMDLHHGHVQMNKDFWHNKNVLITGVTGFKGSWLALWLESIGANVTGVSLDPPSQPNLYTEASISEVVKHYHTDICDTEAVKKIFLDSKPSIVFHMAAQSLVRYSYENPIETYRTNVLGTLSILEAIKSSDSVRSGLMITTDKVYDNKEWLWGYRENDAMGGFDPYSSSKGAAELLISSYRNSFLPITKYSDHRVSLASVRAGNVIGGGDWAKDRLIPDIIKSLENDQLPEIRNPDSTRPWQHVLEPLHGYLTLAEKMVDDDGLYSEPWNFGPELNDVKSVRWIVDNMLKHWKKEIDWDDQFGNHPHEANFLKLDCSKAHQELEWFPIWNLQHTLKKIYEWNYEYKKFSNARDITLQQISEYMDDRTKRKNLIS